MTRTLAASESAAVATSWTLQRKCSCGKSSSGSECKQCEEEKKRIQRKSRSHVGAISAPPIVDEVLGSAGEALPIDAQSFMQSRFGHDFANIRVHASARAAESARAVDALAYTAGHHVVFAAGQYAPGTERGRHLLAHELAHSLQQRGSQQPSQGGLRVEGNDTPAEAAAERAAQAAMDDRAAAPPVGRSPMSVFRKAASPSVCDDSHAKSLAAATSTAAQWLASVSQWFDTNASLVKKRSPRYKGDFRRIGSELFAQVAELDRHFGYSEIVRKEWRSRFPDSENWEGTFDEFQALGRASYAIRKKFGRVRLTDLVSHCETPCPENRDGAELAGSARPGSGEYTIYTDCFDRQSPKAKAGVVLHEAFHASFSDFSGDSYSHTKGYPGDTPLANADSFATFAAVAATGSSFRVVEVPVTITASPERKP